MKKIALLIIVLFLSGCPRGGAPLWTSSWWGGTPGHVTVIKGDTVYSLSKRYNVPQRDLIEANRLRPPFTLYAGQTLRLPAARIHTVARGDTLYNISKRYNVDITSLSRQNNLRAPYTLSLGQKLALPASVGGASAYGNASAPSSSSAASSGGGARRTAAVAAVESVRARKSKFSWPLRGQIISPYGAIAKGRSNDGINIKTSHGADVRSADGGTIAYAGSELKGFGNLVLIRHDGGWITAYAHNERLLVKKGQKVSKGEKIALAGSTGGVNAPQLHFEIRQGKKALNPVTYLEK
jgi:murein DD-endopeptidase MepM/ murein hydrolase activator NlpD